MRHEILLLSHAKDDIREAKNYYNTIIPLLGKRFIDDFRITLNIIAANPFIYSSRIEGFRTANLKIFPYYLAYLTHREEIWVLAIAHSARRPEYWISRTLP